MSRVTAHFCFGWKSNDCNLAISRNYLSNRGKKVRFRGKNQIIAELIRISRKYGDRLNWGFCFSLIQLQRPASRSLHPIK